MIAVSSQRGEKPIKERETETGFNEQGTIFPSISEFEQNKLLFCKWNVED